MQRFDIQNIFASFSLDSTIDVENLSKEFTKSIYDPQLSPSLEIRDDEHGIVFRVFNTGQVTCLGGKSENEVRSGIRTFLEKLKQKNYIISTDVKVEISNYVATLNFGKRIRMWKAAYFLKGSKYNCHRLPWLIYESEKPKVLFHIFENGKIICTGAQNRREILAAFKALKTQLKENSLWY